MMFTSKCGRIKYQTVLLRPDDVSVVVSFYDCNYEVNRQTLHLYADGRIRSIPVMSCDDVKPPRVSGMLRKGENPPQLHMFICWLTYFFGRDNECVTRRRA